MIMRFMYVIVDDSRWQTIVRTSNGPLTEYTVSYQNLLPSTSYLFRVISYNRYGISYPAYSSETVSLLKRKKTIIHCDIKFV